MVGAGTGTNPPSGGLLAMRRSRPKWKSNRSDRATLRAGAIDSERSVAQCPPGWEPPRQRTTSNCCGWKLHPRRASVKTLCGHWNGPSAARGEVRKIGDASGSPFRSGGQECVISRVIGWPLASRRGSITVESLMILMQMTTRLVAGALALALVVGCRAQQPAAPPAQDGADAGRSQPGVSQGPPGWFDVKGEDVGLAFTHFNGMSGQYYFPEMLPAGVGLLDYDNDGDLDVYLVQGDMLGEGKSLARRLVSSACRLAVERPAVPERSASSMPTAPGPCISPT